MQPVTDPQLLERLNQRRQQSVDEPSAVVDPALQERLNQRRQSLMQPEQVQEAPTAPPPSQGSNLLGGGEVALTALTGILAEPVSGLWGALSTLGYGGDVGKGVESIENARKFLTYMPKTEEGAEMLASLGGALEPVAELAESINRSLGNFAYDFTGSPTAAAAAYSLPTAILEAGGLKTIKTLSRMTPEAMRVRAAQKQMLEDPVQRYNADVADVKLDARGNVVPDATAENLINLGFSRNDTAVITNSTKESKQLIDSMLDDFLAASKNPVEGQTRRMTKNIGDSVSKRLGYLSSRRKGLGQTLDNLVETELSGINVNVAPAVNEFTQLLRNDFGVRFRIDGSGKLSIDNIDQTPLGTATLSSTRRLITDAVDLLNQQTMNGTTSAKQAHKLKKVFDEMLDSSKLSEGGLSNNTQRRLLTLRKGINDSINAASPEYQRINQQLGTVIEAMSPFSRFLPDGASWTDAKSSVVVGNAMKSLKGSSRAGEVLGEDIGKLEAAVRSLGADFPDDPRALVQAYDTINQYFKVSEDELIRNVGKLDQRVKSQIVDTAGSLAVRNVFGAVHDIARLRELGLSRKQANEFVKTKREGLLVLKKALNE